MAISMTQALLAKFVSSGVDDFDDSSGLWFDEIPENVPLPFVVFEHNGETCEYYSESEYVEVGSHTFHVFAVTVAEAERLAKIVMDVYDACIKQPGSAFTITSQKVTAFSRSSRNVVAWKDRNDSAKQIGEVNFTYEHTVRKTLPS